MRLVGRQFEPFVAHQPVYFEAPGYPEPYAPKVGRLTLEFECTEEESNDVLNAISSLVAVRPWMGNP